MYFTFGNYTLSIIEYETKNEMLSVLKNCKFGSLVLGDEYGYDEKYYIVKLYTLQNYDNYFCIGILSEGHGLRPHIMIRQIDEEIIIGLNEEVVSISCFDKKIRYTIKLNSLFHSFIESNKHSTILLFHELGVVAIALNGEEKWRFDGEIIDSYDVQEDLIELKFLEEGKVRLSIIDGTLAE